MRIVKAAPVMAKVRDDIDQVFDRMFRTTFAPEALLRTPAPAPETIRPEPSSPSSGRSLSRWWSRRRYDRSR